MLAAAVCLVANACATFNATFKERAAEEYERDKAPPAQFAKDGEICAKQAAADQRNLGTGGDIDPTHSTYNRMFDACMRASGYRRKPQPE